MNAKTRTLTMGLVGVLLAAGIIGGINAVQRDLLSSTSRSPIGSSSESSITTLSNTQSSLGTGVLAVQLTDPPNVPNGVTNVFINYSEIDVHIAGVGQASGWYNVANSSVIDLMSLVNISMTIGSAPVSSGVFNLVRFDINSATITFLGKNYTARVPSNHLTVPIDSGGITIASNGSAGLLIDVSPTVVPLMNNSVPGFILVPAARSFPVPGQYWSPNLVKPGGRDYRRWWVAFEQNYTSGAVRIVGASLSSSSLEVMVKNTGNASISITGIAISANISIVQVVPTLSTTSSAQSPISNVSVGILNTTLTISENTGVISNNQSYYERLRTIATFAILWNGTLVQEPEAMALPLSSLGFVLQPGQTQSFVFNSTIVTFTGVDNVTTRAIVPGLQYTISVLGGFETQSYVNVKAT